MKIIEEVAQHVRHGGGIKIIALEFLADLAQYDEFCLTILNTDMMDLYEHAGVSADKGLRIGMLQMLKHLSLQRDDVRAAIVQHHVSSSIVQMLHTHEWDIASAVIARMVAKADICSAFLDLGTPDKLVQLLDDDHLGRRPEDFFWPNGVIDALRAFSRHDTAREYMLSVSFLSPVKQLFDVSNFGFNKIALEIFEFVIKHDDDFSILHQLDILPRLEIMCQVPQERPLSSTPWILAKKLLRRIKESSKDEGAQEGGESSGLSAGLQASLIV